MQSVDAGRPLEPRAELLRSELEPLLARLARTESLSSQSRGKFAALIAAFAGYLEGSGVGTLSEVLPQHVADFLAAPSSREPGLGPAVATMHLRRSAVRLLFRLAREAGFPVGDPSLDIALPHRAGVGHRPLSDAEVLLCRSVSLHTLTETRLAAAWALAEASARTSEIPSVRRSDLDIGGARVWLHGGTKTEPRWAPLDGWATAQLERRVAALTLATDQNPPLVYEGFRGGASAQASACITISWTLRRAGLVGQPGVRPTSVAAWAGRRGLEEGLSLDEVVHRLGMRSLDRTAAFIGLERMDREGPPD